MDKLSASEAIYGFVSWMTTRDEKLSIGADSDCAPFPSLIEEFCEANKLSPVGEDWPMNLIHPSGECSAINR